MSREVRVVPANGVAAPNGPREPPPEDVVAEAAGDCGPWQYKLTAMLSLFYLPSTWHMTAITFQIVQPPFFCQNDTVTFFCKLSNKNLNLVNIKIWCQSSYE